MPTIAPQKLIYEMDFSEIFTNKVLISVPCAGEVTYVLF